MGHAWLRKITTVLAVLAFLLQVAAVVSPGWIIYIKGNIEEHHSLFYRVSCKTLMDERICKVESFHYLHDDMRAKLEKAQVSREKIATIDFEYHSLICKQVLMIAAVCLTMAMALSQITQSIKKKTYTRLIIVSAVTATTSAGIVIAVACNDIVNVCYQIKLYQMDSHRDHTYVGFPYCLGMLLGSALLIFFSMCSISPQLHKPKLRVKPRPMMVIDDAPSSYVPPITTLNEVSEPTKYDKGNDNPVFSEKL